MPTAPSPTSLEAGSAQAPTDLSVIEPRRRLMTVSSAVRDALMADWPELAAEGVDDLVDLKSAEATFALQELNTAETDGAVTLAVSTANGWVYLENRRALGTQALERHIMRAFPAESQSYKLAAPISSTSSTLADAAMYSSPGRTLLKIST